jgi:hypothetical protein
MLERWISQAKSDGTLLLGFHDKLVADLYGRREVVRRDWLPNLDAHIIAANVLQSARKIGKRENRRPIEALPVEPATPACQGDEQSNLYRIAGAEI